ncbi:hypothetical protein DL764_010632 [Monosporascus ibericus]|uniref:Heterokaryon incompatibility domain-containing protein n=1 Tax=Monosporascus ibericus TaxID=155417 RepID=A0A4Q4SSI0_9PEZI|nr:hypothetical protein DL764_010632 [Monosporascus ibericus]
MKNHKGEEELPEWAQEGEEESPEWAQENDDLPEWAHEGEVGDTSFGIGGMVNFARMREFERDHADRRLHRPCPGCGRYPMNDQSPKEVYSSEQRLQWKESGCLSCYAIWQCSLAVRKDVVRVSGDLVWFARENMDVLQVRLYNEVGTKDPVLQFGSSSHSWGKSQPLRTLKNNVVSHTNGIAIESVPRTFQDAIRVTRHLDIRYLWIDSLCIVQDDGDDWAKEATKMADYYTGAEVVIATSSSTGCTQGFLGARPEIMKGTLQIPRYKGSQKLLPLHFREALLGDSGSIARQVGYQKDTLWTRGWCYQERLLARRYLSFGRRELLWECNAACHCESSDVSNPDLGIDAENTGTGSDHDYNLSLGLSRSSKADLYKFWMVKVVQHYAHRSLTKYTDRLVAVQGVAAVLEKHLGDEYVYGIWKGDALWGLSWSTRADPGATGPRVPLDIAPTWSWASLYGPVEYRLWPERTWSVEFLGFGSPEEKLEANRASPLSIELRSQLLTAHLETADDDINPLRLVLQDKGRDAGLFTTDVFLDTPCQRILVGTLDGDTIETANRVAASTCTSGEQEQRPKWVTNDQGTITVWLLHLYSNIHYLHSEFLVLGRSSSHSGVYERIGISNFGQTVARYNQVQGIIESSPEREVSII